MLTIGYVMPSTWEFCQSQDSYGFAPDLNFESYLYPFLDSNRGRFIVNAIGTGVKKPTQGWRCLAALPSSEPQNPSPDNTPSLNGLRTTTYFLWMIGCHTERLNPNQSGSAVSSPKKRAGV